MNAVMGALEAHTAMSTQAINSEKVRKGLKDVLLGPAQLYEALRAKGDQAMVWCIGSTVSSGKRRHD